MTYDEITLFWRFLQDKSTRQNYEYFYEHHRFDKRDIDTFLEQVEAEDAILTAFNLSAAPSSIFSPRYWQTLNEKWYRRLAEFRADGCRLGGPTLVTCQHCGRQLPPSAFAYGSKGQMHKHCKECESGAWDRQRREQEAADKEREKQEKAMRVLEKEIAEKMARLDRLAGTAESTAQEGKEDTEPPACTAEADGASKCSPKLGEHDATLHYKPDSRKIVFNAILSACIQTAGLTKCYLSTDRDGRQFLVFNNAEGANVTWTNTKSSRLAQVCSTNHCKQIAERFRLSIGDLYYLHITKNLSKVQGTINIEIKQVHSREEYAAIAARREEEQKTGALPGVDIPEYETAKTMPADDEAPLLDFGETRTPAAKAANSPFGAALRSGLDAGGQANMIPLAGKKPADTLQQLVDRGHLTERDIASFLYNRGWKLQEPVVVTTHKKFKA